MSGNYTLPLMGAILALSFTACDKPGTVPDEPNNPTTKQETTESDYVTIVLEDENGNDVLRALGEGSTNPQVGVYKYKDEFPEALAYMDLPGDKNNNFKVSKDEFESKGVSIPVYANPNVVIAGGSWSPLPNQADPLPVTNVVIETFGKTGILPTANPFPIPPMPAPASNKIYVKLNVGGPTNEADYTMQAFLDEKPLTYQRYRDAKTKTIQVGTRSVKEFNYNSLWIFNVNLINPFFWAGYHRARADGADNPFWFYTEEPVYKTIEVVSKGWHDEVIEIAPTYTFKLTSLKGKSFPKTIDLEIVYDEISGSFELTNTVNAVYADAYEPSLVIYKTFSYIRDKKATVRLKETNIPGVYKYDAFEISGLGEDDASREEEINSYYDDRLNFFHFIYTPTFWTQVIKNVKPVSLANVATVPYLPTRTSVNFDASGNRITQLN